jgi:hypothetical protein
MSIVHSLSSGTLGFRGVFALALVPLALCRSREASVVGWSLAARVLGAGTGLVA